MFNLPNAQAASLVWRFTSATTEGTLLPKKTKSSTLSMIASFRVIWRSSCDMILHLLGLIFIPHLLQAFSSSFVDICSFSKTMSISVVSSAYRMLLMRMSPIWIPLSKFWRSFITNSRNRLKRLGDRRHPCLTPVTTLNHSVILPVNTDRALCLLVHTFDQVNHYLVYTNGTQTYPQSFSPDGVKCCLEVYKVPVKRYSSLFGFLNDLRTTNTASVVPRDCRKPHCSSVR